ncbi:MAG: serine/threonine protein kinase, partial [Myxococcales bacterium]|nr:serine/threonine protein kinase [Myxococcales bacterium]
MHSRGDLVGTELEGRYRILSRLGEGGMGTVYVAQHLGLGSRCAVKVLRSELGASATARERFLREARIASQLGERNPHIVKVMDLGCLPDGSGFYAMEWLQGEDLAATLTRAGRLPWPRVRHFALQICAALAGAHAAGIVHRDLKPENCFRVQVGDDPDFIKLLDFGVAHMSVPGTGKLTEMGQALGTAAYMSPEQAAGQGGDHRIDIYALGVIMYEMLTGYQPFEAGNAWLVQAKIVSEDPPAMAALCPEAELGPEIEALVTTAMRRRPEQRFASVAELAAAIAAVRHVPPPVGPRATTLPPSRRDTAYAATLAASPSPPLARAAPPTAAARPQPHRPASPPSSSTAARAPWRV